MVCVVWLCVHSLACLRCAAGGNEAMALACVRCAAGANEAMALACVRCAAGGNEAMALASLRCAAGANEAMALACVRCAAGGNEAMALAWLRCAAGGNEAMALAWLRCAAGANQAMALAWLRCAAGANEAMALAWLRCAAGGNEAMALACVRCAAGANEAMALAWLRRSPLRQVKTRDRLAAAVHIEKFSYLVLAKGPAGEMISEVSPAGLGAEELQELGMEQEHSHFARLLAPPIKRSRHLIVDVCTPFGSFERRTIGKSKGVAGGYRQAKETRWGDLWPYSPGLSDDEKEGRQTHRETQWWYNRKTKQQPPNVTEQVEDRWRTALGQAAPDEATTPPEPEASVKTFQGLGDLLASSAKGDPNSLPGTPETNPLLRRLVDAAQAAQQRDKTKTRAASQDAEQQKAKEEEEKKAEGAGGVGGHGYTLEQEERILAMAQEADRTGWKDNQRHRRLRRQVDRIMGLDQPGQKDALQVRLPGVETAPTARHRTDRTGQSGNSEAAGVETAPPARHR
eukprot:g5277.t1